MRPLSVKDLKNEIDYWLTVFGNYVERGRWVYECYSLTLSEADLDLRLARRAANRRIIRLVKQSHRKRRYIHLESLHSVLAAAAWRYVLRLKESGSLQQQPREEMDLELVAELGKEAKRLSFQLEA